MKIAMCSKGVFSLELGATKNRIELAEGLKKMGWEATLIDKQLLGVDVELISAEAAVYNTALKNYLILHAMEYDVVLYEYDSLPFDRNLFDPSTLFVARPAILAYHLQEIKFNLNLKTKLRDSFMTVKNKITGQYKKVDAYYKNVDYSLSQADLIQVQNKKDYQLLVQKGFTKEKIEIIPNGISAERIEKFAIDNKKYNGAPVIAYVGTFDFRKGAMDFPLIFNRLKGEFKDLKLKLFGTRGLFATAEQVLDFFPAKYHSSIEVVPRFKAEDLPMLLSGCGVGIFPSYLESFGFGALEMMCAGLPVVAYDSPGPSDFILSDLLVSTGDYKGLADKVKMLLKDRSLLEQKSVAAHKLVVEKHNWEDIAKTVDSCYRKRLGNLREVNLSISSN